MTILCSHLSKVNTSAGISTVQDKSFDLMVAGFHRACPSTTLDKKLSLFIFILIDIIIHTSKVQVIF